MGAPGGLLATSSSGLTSSAHIAESASKPAGFGRAMVGNLRRPEAHETFIAVTIYALELRWWGAMGRRKDCAC
jgi:hypothetical protein